MCAATTEVPDGKLLSCTAKVTLPPPVTAPVLSRGTLKVMVAVPRPPDSAPETGGTSLAALSVVEKTIGPVVDGPVGVLSLLSSHAAAMASAIIRIAARFIFG